jgi:hypothetical protein
MKTLGRLLFGGLLVCGFANTHAVPSFGALATGSDLEPSSAFLRDGGPGSASASVSFSTFRSEARFDPMSTYLPILKAESRGVDATFDDDRTQAGAEAYQAFTSSMAQTIVLDITLDSIVTNAPSGTSGVLSNIYVIGGSGFSVSDGYCSPGQFTFDGVYLCGVRIATSNSGLSFSNLFNDGSSPVLTDQLTFTVAAGESFGIYADLSAGSFKGTADAFNTLSLEFEDDEFIEPVELPQVSEVPSPPVVLLFGAGLLGIVRFTRKSNKAA